MSVLIKNFKMPACCDICIFSDWSNKHQTVACKLLEYQPAFSDYSTEYERQRSDKCPLQECSEPMKTGKWIFVHPLQKDDPGAYMCSVCQNGDWNIKPTDRYCKFCGARMEGEEEYETY